jgi:predicted double-glycine peptidase
MTLQATCKKMVVTRAIALCVCLSLVATVEVFSQVPFKGSGAVIRQSNPLTCGPAAIATLLTFYYDDPSSEQDILKLTNVTGRGISIEELEKALAAKRYNVETYPMTFAMLLKEVQEAPVIVLFPGDVRHYVVVIGSSADYLLIADPARGEVLSHKDEFLRLWSVATEDLRYGQVVKIKSTRPLNKQLIDRRRNSAAIKLRAAIRAATWNDAGRY